MLSAMAKASDGIGGTIKCLVARSSLQATKEGQILTPMQLYSWANQHVTGIKVMFVSKQDIAEHSLKIEPRFQNAKTAVGTRGHHRFVPLADNKLRMHRLSMEQLYKLMYMHPV